MSDRKLHDAAGRGDEALVSQLIKQGAKMDWKDDKDTGHHCSTPGSPWWSNPCGHQTA